jgi:hypothetical protein
MIERIEHLCSNVKMVRGCHVSWFVALTVSACTFHVDAVAVPESEADLAVADSSPSPPSPILSGAHTTIPATVDLTAEGTADWLHAGLMTASDVNRKSGGAPLLVLTTKGAGGQYGMYQPTYSWSNGTPTVSATTNGGIYMNGVGSGATLTMTAAATTRTVNVYVTAFNAHATLTAHLTDGAVADYSDTQAVGTANTFFKYTVTVRDAAPSAQLVITWILAQAGTGYSSVDFMAATAQ